MSFLLRADPSGADFERIPRTFFTFSRLSPLLNYKIIANLKGYVTAANILNHAINISKNPSINHQALGPTRPLSLQPPQGSKIRRPNQTASSLATENMHASKNMAVLKRFAHVVIERNAIQNVGKLRLQARMFNHAENDYSIWDRIEKQDKSYATRPITSNTIHKNRAPAQSSG